MARSKSHQSEEPRAANLTADEMAAGVKRLSKRINEVEAFDPNTVTDQFDHPELNALEAEIDQALVATFGANTLDYLRYYPASRFDTGPLNMMYETPLHTVRAAIASSKAKSLALLNSAVKSLKEQLDEVGASIVASEASQVPRQLMRSVFIVHGHDEGAREMVARFLERIGFKAVILHEQANRGRTVIEKVEANSEVGFAIVLLTPDDEGRKAGDSDFEPRARQNVLLELGYFIGRLGRENVCALKRGNVEIPSDFAGIVWEDMDGSGGWRQGLGRELQAAGHEIDWNKVMRV